MAQPRLPLQASAAPMTPRAQAFLARIIEAERERLGLWSPVAAGFGAWLYFAQSQEPGLTGLWGALGIAVALSLVAWRAPMLRSASVALALTALGFAAGCFRTLSVAAPIIEETGRSVYLTGQVLDVTGSEDGKARVLIAPNAISGLAPEQLPAKVRLSLRKTDARPAPGTMLTVLCQLSPPPQPAAPYAFDYARDAWFERIGAFGFVLGHWRAVPGEAASGGMWTAINALRFAWSARIREGLAGAEGAIAAALTVGDRGDIAPADLDALRDSSLMHVISISGLHLAIVGLGVFGLVRFGGALVPPLALGFPLKKIAAGAGLLAAFLYLLISGGGVPAQRAFIMLALMFAAVMIDRSPFSLRLVALAALAIVLAAPETVLDPSFQMSFAAVTALIAAAERFEARRPQTGLFARDRLAGRLFYVVLAAVIASLAAGLATMPFISFHFHRVASYGLAANLSAMPVISLMVMPGVALTLLALPFGLEAAPLWLLGQGIAAMLAIAHEVTAWPGASLLTAAFPGAFLALTVLGGLMLCLCASPALRWAGLMPVLAGVTLALSLPERPDVLVDREAKTVMLRGADGRLAPVNAKRARFALALWLERDGDGRSLRQATADARAAGVWQCREQICTAVVQRGAASALVAFLDSKADVSAACRQSFDLVVSVRPLAACGSAPIIVSPMQAAASGAQHFTLTEQALQSVSSNAVRGTRPWIGSASQPLSNDAEDPQDGPEP